MIRSSGRHAGWGREVGWGGRVRFGCVRGQRGGGRKRLMLPAPAASRQGGEGRQTGAQGSWAAVGEGGGQRDQRTRGSYAGWAGVCSLPWCAEGAPAQSKNAGDDWIDRKGREREREGVTRRETRACGRGFGFNRKWWFQGRSRRLFLTCLRHHPLGRDGCWGASAAQ